MKRKYIFKILIILFSAVFIISGINIVNIFLGYHKASSAYKDLQNRYTEIISETMQTESGETYNIAPINVNFEALLAENTDVVGWIYCPDTRVNYPVLQADDNDRYLYHDFKGNYSSAGAIFGDYRNNTVGIDKNYVVYGHNMKDGSMFGTLIKYKQQSFYDSHPYMYYITKDSKYKIEIYAGIVVPTDSVFYEQNPDEASFTEALLGAKDSSTFKSPVTVGDDDLLITLSTCSYEYDNARFILIGILKPI